MCNRNRPPPCNKVKNPCKYCLQQVTNKNGLQCQGACQKWAHFKCLNYTPGKISDIKAGIIKVTCPCPDCNTKKQKEYLTNPPYTCSNHQCPANKAPKCDSFDCPSNRRGRPMPCYTPSCPSKECINKPISCPSSPRPPCTPKKISCGSSDCLDVCLDVCPESPKCVKATKCTPSSTSETELCPKTQEAMVEALEEMCSTVGQLSVQLKELMCKLVDNE